MKILIHKLKEYNPSDRAIRISILLLPVILTVLLSASTIIINKKLDYLIGIYRSTFLLSYDYNGRLRVTGDVTVSNTVRVYRE